jgi:Domain of Unknown Function (DUF928)
MKHRAWKGRQGALVLTLAYLVSGVLGGAALPVHTAAQEADAIIYKPPRRGAPGGREGAGSRGFREHVPALVVLTPKDHVGLTVQEQPVLYWYLSQEAKYPVEVTLTDRQSIRPLLEKRLAPPLQPGLHVLRLADYGVHLTPGVPYKWSVALITNPTARSQDIITSGGIERTTPSDELRSQLAQANKMTVARLYAASGIWYDTLAVLSELIDAAPQNAQLRQQRAALLEQEGLLEVAAYDKRH